MNKLSVTRFAAYFTVAFSVFQAAPPLACATEVALVGVMGGKALVSVDGGSPRSLAIGQKTAEGIKLISVGPDEGVFEVNGKRQTVRMGGQAVNIAGDSGPATVRLTADGRGHFLAQGTVNNVGVRFLVDTGASFISLGAADARRAGIDLNKGVAGYATTANGVTQVTRVKLDSVKLGSITMHNVDAAVHGHDLPVALLGMSFLNRVEMQREGDTMTLKKRF